jgi:hypothetical protein
MHCCENSNLTWPSTQSLCFSFYGQIHLCFGGVCSLPAAALRSLARCWQQAVQLQLVFSFFIQRDDRGDADGSYTH